MYVWEARFIQLLGYVVLDCIVHEVSIFCIFWVMADTTPNVSSKNQ